MALATSPRSGSGRLWTGPGPGPGTGSGTDTRAGTDTGPGLGSRMASVSDALGALVADLDPDALAGTDATALYADSAAWSVW